MAMRVQVPPKAPEFLRNPPETPMIPALSSIACGVCAMVVNQSSYLFLRNNTYYFSRRIPLDMKSLYGSKRIVKSLKTRSKRVALRGSTQISFQLETY